MAQSIDLLEADGTLRTMPGRPDKKAARLSLWSRFLLAILVLCAVTAHAEDLATIRAAAEGGNTAAIITMGAVYHYGHGVRQDDTEASRWYLLAATQGHAGAQCIVGMLFLVGQGVAQNDAQAKYWLRRAAAQGDAQAQQQLNRIRQQPSGE